MPQESEGMLRAEQLFPQVYDQLRKLASRHLAHESSNHTLQATALVNETYLRLVRDHDKPCWSHRGHLLAAAAQAMRRVLVDHARRKQSLKRGRGHTRLSLDVVDPAVPECDSSLLIIDEALARLEVVRPDLASLVLLRYFAELTMEQVADVQGISLRMAERNWTCAKAWLLQDVADELNRH